MRKLKLIAFPEFDSIKLCAGHSMITSSVPEFINLGVKKIEKLNQQHIESFGLFESASPNFQTYYPDVIVSDLANPEDYIEPVFRCLSEVIVRKSFDPIDFTKNGVLKASMSKLMGQTLYPNHEALVGNEIGVVSKTFWETGYKIGEYSIPAGINGKFKINAKTHPKIAAGILSEPPEIHSNSVTVFFGWEQSHSKLSSDEFRNKVGTYDDKGELIRRVVTDIRSYNETSLVPHGADPFAQIIRDGKINNPQFASDRDSSSDGKGNTKRFFNFSFKESLAELSNITIPDDYIQEHLDNKNHNKNKMKKSFAILIAAIAGLTLKPEMLALSDEEFETQFDEEAFQAEVKTAEVAVTELRLIKDDSVELAALKTENTELKKFKTDNAANIVLAATAQTEMLNEVKRLYGIVAKDKQDASVIATLENSDYGTLKVFKSTYAGQVEESFSVECPNCKKRVSLASAEHEGGEGNIPPKPKTLTEAREILSARKINISNIHGK